MQTNLNKILKLTALTVLAIGTWIIVYTLSTAPFAELPVSEGQRSIPFWALEQYRQELLIRGLLIGIIFVGIGMVGYVVLKATTKTSGLIERGIEEAEQK